MDIFIFSVDIFMSLFVAEKGMFPTYPRLFRFFIHIIHIIHILTNSGWCKKFSGILTISFFTPLCYT